MWEIKKPGLEVAVFESQSRKKQTSPKISAEMVPLLGIPVQKRGQLTTQGPFKNA